MSTPDGDPEGPRSGLRDPDAATRRVGQVTLALEAVSLLLALRPVAVLGDGVGPLGLASVGVLAVACLLLSGLLARSWTWRAGTALQLAVVATGLFSWAMAVLGVVFLATWLYVVRLRATVARPASPDHQAPNH